MSNFKKFKEAVRKQFDKMAAGQLYTVMLDKDALWNTYLESYPPGTNEIYKTRREHDCNCCKSFIRRAGNIVAIGPDLKITSIWDIKVEEPFQPVADALSEFVKSRPIDNQFLSKEPCAGVDVTRQLAAGLTEGLGIGKDDVVKTWDHFFAAFPAAYVHKSKTESVEAVLGARAADYQVFSRSMRELTLEAGQTVLELIDAGSIYRGEEQKASVVAFIKEKQAYDALSEAKRATYCWTRLGKTHVTRVRNTALGTLLIDLSAGMDVDEAVRKFEHVMAPANYKRPKAVFTKKMVEAAEAKIKELGFEESLGRRHAVIEDVTINNVLFVNRDAKKAMGVFDSLKSDVVVDPKKFKKVEEVTIDEFIDNVLPHATTLELMPEGRHIGNLMSLVAPVNRHAPSMFKWSNNFSWSYNGDIADSMKQNVKKAGGKVDGVLRFSIQWNENNDNYNDFDAHCIEPDRHEISFRDKVNPHTLGNLDVDIIHPDGVAVENITWPDESRMPAGDYVFFVHNWTHRGGSSGFRAEIEYNGEIHQYSHDRDIKQGCIVEVATLNYRKRPFGIEFVKSMDSIISSRTMWGVKTGDFRKVMSLMMSPNHWDDQKGLGNRHFFFIMEGCVAETPPRPYYNEFLKEELTPHRQVFEALGAKMRVETAENGLSGFGFSSTTRNSVLCRVTGKVTRIVKILF